MVAKQPVRILSTRENNSTPPPDPLSQITELFLKTKERDGYLSIFPDWHIDNNEIEEKNGIIEINLAPDEGKHKQTECPYCHRERPYRHGFSNYTCRDTPLCGLPVKLHLRIQRHQCQFCRRTWNEIPSWIHKEHMVTKRLHEFVRLVLSSVDVTANKVAKETGLHWSTVKEIEKEGLIKKFEYIDTSDVKYIAMDEISIRKRHTYATIIIDALTRRALYICEGRTKSDIQPFFDLLRERGHHTNILGATMDGNAGFAKIVKDNCPKVMISLDKFHVLMNFNRDVVDRVRIDKHKEIKKKLMDLSNDASDDEKKELKNKAEDLKNLKWESYGGMKKINNNLEIDSRIKDIIKDNEPLATVLMLYDLLFDLWEPGKTPKQVKIEANNFIKACKNSGIKEAINFAKKFERQIPHVINASHLGLNTSVLEGCNNKAKVIKRISYGFRDMQYYFLKLFQALLGKTQLPLSRIATA